jgi:hypothetical protein
LRYVGPDTALSFSIQVVVGVTGSLNGAIVGAVVFIFAENTRNGRGFLTRTPRRFAGVVSSLPLATLTPAWLRACSLFRSVGHRRSTQGGGGVNPRRLRLGQHQDGCARFGPNCRLGANPGFVIRGTRAQIINRRIGRDQRRPFRRPGIPRAARDILNQFGPDAEDMAAIGAADRAGFHALVCALIARAARGEPRTSR